MVLDCGDQGKDQSLSYRRSCREGVCGFGWRQHEW